MEYRRNICKGTDNGFRMQHIARRLVLIAGCLLCHCAAGFAPTLRTKRGTSAFMLESSTTKEDEYDVLVIGAGIGGLSCAALSAKYGLKTLCVECHDTAGGCAHSFERYSSASKTTPFCFDSGPSLITGLSSKGTNPLRQVLDAVGTAGEIDWQTYDGWLVHDLADGKTFKLTTGDGGEFEKALEEKAGKQSREAFEKFRDEMLGPRGLSEASAYIPPFALRGGARAVFSLAKYTLKLLSIGTKGNFLTGPFTSVMDYYNMNDPFIRKWFDYLAFALSGEDAAHTQAAPVAYMMADLHRAGKVLDYPRGGMESLIQALVKGLENHSGELLLKSRVERVLLDNKGGSAHCSGIVLDDGRVIRAKQGVVSNAPLWNTARILEDSIDETTVDQSSDVARAVQEIRQQANEMNMTRSFMHLHLGIPSRGIPDDIECHHSVLNMEIDITAEQNMVIISIPTVFDKNLAPDGYHIVHAYTAACDDFDLWSPFIGEESGKVGSDPNSSTASKYSRESGYQELKEEKAEVLWRAVEKVIPDVRERAKRKGSVVMVGTPLTHRRYNQRYRGTYGPAPNVGEDVWKLGGATTKIKGLLVCGDTSFPGIGLPGVAASGTIAANTLVTVKTQMKLMSELKKDGSLQ